MKKDWKLRSAWEVFREFHNKKKDEDGFYTRKELFQYLKDNGVDLNSHSNTTIDHYRNMAQVSGFLSRSIPGIYYVKYKIPEQWTSKRLRSFYDRVSDNIEQDYQEIKEANNL